MGGLTVPDRVRWAVTVVAPEPGDTVLEIGCGPGAAAQLICERLDSGRMIAVDRSAVAIERTARRNAAHVDAGRLSVRTCPLGTAGLADIAPASVDRAFAVDVNLFWTGRPEDELAALARLLRPGGTLHVLYGATSPAGAARVVDAVTAGLTAHPFTDVRPVSGPGGFGVAARRARDR